MSKSGLQKGDEAYVSIRINKFLACDILISAISPSEVAADLYADEACDLVSVYEALKAALGGIGHQLEAPRLKELLNERIAQLKKESEEEGSEPPYPDGYLDIPF